MPELDALMRDAIATQKRADWARSELEDARQIAREAKDRAEAAYWAAADAWKAHTGGSHWEFESALLDAAQPSTAVSGRMREFADWVERY